MAKLILIKHASVRVVPGQPPETWRLSDEGRSRSAALADALRPFAPARIVTSAEPKARETGDVVAGRLGVPAETANGLHEHVRTRVPHMHASEFISMVELFFREHDRRVLGEESADEALARFESAVSDVMTRHFANEAIAIVTHGTVLSLLVARHNPDRQAFALWRELQLPSFVVLTWPQMQLEHIVPRVQ